MGPAAGRCGKAAAREHSFVSGISRQISLPSGNIPLMECHRQGKTYLVVDKPYGKGSGRSMIEPM